MSGFDVFLVCYWVLNIVVTVATVEKRREPLTPGAAAIAVLLFLGLITALLISRDVIA